MAAALGSDLMTAPMKMIDNKTVESKCETTTYFFCIKYLHGLKNDNHLIECNVVIF